MTSTAVPVTSDALKCLFGHVENGRALRGFFTAAGDELDEQKGQRLC